MNLHNQPQEESKLNGLIFHFLPGKVPLVLSKLHIQETDTLIQTELDNFQLYNSFGVKLHVKLNANWIYTFYENLYPKELSKTMSKSQFKKQFKL